MTKNAVIMATVPIILVGQKTRILDPTCPGQAAPGKFESWKYMSRLNVPRAWRRAGVPCDPEFVRGARSPDAPRMNFSKNLLLTLDGSLVYQHYLCSTR